MGQKAEDFFTRNLSRAKFASLNPRILAYGKGREGPPAPQAPPDPSPPGWSSADEASRPGARRPVARRRSSGDDDEDDDDGDDAGRKERKAASKREKKARRKERARAEAAGRAAADEARRRGTCITSWRSRVVTGCGGGDVARVEALLDDHPFGEDCAAAETARHMEWLAGVSQ